MKAKIGAILLGAAVLIGGGVVLGGGTWVGVGQVGIIKPMEGQPSTIGYGWHWVGYGVAVDKLPIGKQSLILSDDKNEGGGEDRHWQIGTSDGQTLDVNTNFVWRIDSTKATQLYLAMGGKDIDTIRDQIVEPQMKNVVQSITHDYTWSDIYGAKQKEVTQKINDQLKINLSKDGIIVDDNAFGFSHIQPPKGMADAQQQVASAELAKQKAQAEQEQQKITNETKIMNAEADAKAAQIEAEGTKAKADALNALVIQEEAIQKWDGKLSQVQGGNGSMMLNIPTPQVGK